MRWTRGVTTVEVMVMLLAISLVVLASYGAKIAAFQAYRDLIHRERAQLYAAETLEQLEALRLTRLQQNYVKSWSDFLGQFSNGSYVLVDDGAPGNPMLRSIGPTDDFQDEDEHQVKIISEEDARFDFYSRLERRIMITQVTTDKRLVEVSIYWGIPGGYTPDSSQQLIVQALYTDHRQPGFAL